MTNLFSDIVLPTVLGASSFAIFGYLLSRVLKKNDVADFLWGLGFVLIAIIQVSQADSLTFRAKLVVVLTLIWGLRLSLHLGRRILLKATEDKRYANWRKEWGKTEPLRAFLQVFALQATVLMFVSLPVSWAIRSPDSPLTPWDFLGLTLFIFGFLFEAVADGELATFKSQPENQSKVMRDGLWAKARHPNYFGEILIWWGMFFLCLPTPEGWLTVVSPLLITYLLLKVSGVPMLQKLLAERGDEFRKHIANTPALLPLGKKELLTFLVSFSTLVLLDIFWLGFLMADFYRTESAPVTRLVNGEWEVLLWPVLGVYFCLGLGVQFFALSSTHWQSFFRGALLGFCIYGTYDFTNLALLSNWSFKMSLVDIGWGPVLCGLTALIASLFNSRVCGTPPKPS